MKYYQTFRFRLARRYALVFGILLCLFSVGLYLGLQSLLYTNLDSTLLSIAESEVAAATDSKDIHWNDFVVNPIAVDQKLHLDKLVQLKTYPGWVLIGKSPNLGSMELPLNREGQSQLSHGEAIFESVRLSSGFPPIRMVTVPILWKGRVSYAMQVGASLLPLQTMRSRLLWVLIIMGGSVLILTGVASVYLAQRTLHPIGQLIDTIQDVTGESLNQRLTVENPNDEFGHLTVALNHMLERLANRFESQQRFIADASHELRSPMATLQIALELALRKPRTQKELHSCVESALQDVVRLTGLINSLLLLSRADHGKLPMAFEPIPLKPFLHQILECYQVQARDKGITLESSLQDVMFAGDELCLQRLLSNLLENALRYTPEHGMIRLTECRQDDIVRISVEDTGIGIPAEHLQHLFERFYRVDKERCRQDGGSGLGLAICQRIVDLHKGTLEVNSNVGQGTTFTVLLPV